MQATGRSAPPPVAAVEPSATIAAVVGALLLALLIGGFVWMALREDAARIDLAAARRAAEPANEGDRIRDVLLKAQAAAERVWRNSTPPEQRRAQEAAMLARLRAEDDATLTMQRLRRLGEAGAAEASVAAH